jgi:hypothetical protein
MADNEVQIDSLSVAIEHSASTASKDLSSLASSLKKLQTSVSALNMWDAVRQFDALGAAAGSLTYFSTALDSLKNAKISSSIGRQLKEIGDAANNLGTLDTTALDKVKSLGEALKPLGELGRAQLTSFINQLAKLPGLAANLDTVDMEHFAATVERLTAAMAPLATEMDKIARGFSAFPQRIQTFIKNNEAATSSVKKSKKEMGGWQDTLGKILGQLEKIEKKPSIFKKLISVAALSKIRTVLNQTIGSANEYIEALNLFYVSMGGYAEKAQQYAEIVGDSYGIDPGEFMRMQAIFMDISKSFGAASGTAYTMSKALTQLTYDISSLYNLKIDEALNKTRSALVGEIEPIRALGKDLSVANLKLLATELGVTANVDAMNQSEKAMLRTISLLRQSKSAMGDMARTLEQPANQFRILKAQLTLLSRAIGDLFLPLVQKVLPYMTAFIKVSQRIVMAFAELAGFKLPKFDYADNIVSGNEDIADSADSAAKSMKKLYQLSFDELNILGSQSTGASGSGTSAADIAKLEAELNRLAKLEDDMFSKNLGETTDKIAEQIENWLTKGEGIQSWAKDIWDYFSKIKDAAKEIADKLGLWEIPQKIWDFFKFAVFKITGIDLDFGASRLRNMSGKDTLMGAVSGGIAALLGLKALGLLSLSSGNGFLGSVPMLLLSIAALSITTAAIGSTPNVTGAQTLLGAAKTGIVALLGGATISRFFLGAEGFQAFGLPLTIGLAGLTMSAVGIFELGNDTGADDLAGAIKLGIGSLLNTAAATLAGVKVAKMVGAGAAAGTAGLFAGALSIIISATIGAVVFPDECRKAFETVSEALGHSIKNVTNSLKDTIDKAVDLGSFDFKAQFGIDENTFKVISTFGDPKLAAQLNEITSVAKQNVKTTSTELDNLNRQFYSSSTIANQNSQSIVNNTTETIKNGINDVTKTGIYKPLYDMMDKVGNELGQKGTSAGKNVAKGFANGTSESSQNAAKAMQELSRMTMQLFTDDLGIHSPSTVFEGYGINVDIGFANGVTLGLPNVKDAFGNVWTSIRVDFSAFANSLLASARTFIRQLNQVLSSASFSGGAAQSLIGKTPRMIPAFATGGFPEDGMFYANSGELVGRFSNGRTAVANNAQIIEGIENAVYRAMTAAQRGSGRGGKIELVLDKQVVGRAFGDAIDSEKRRSGANTKITFTNGGTR